MQPWRLMRFVTFALAVLAAPGWLPAQEPAKKETPAAASPDPAARQAKAAAPAPAPVAAPAPVQAVAPAAEKEFQFFAFMSDPAYGLVEKMALWIVLGIAVAGLIYAVGLVSQVSVPMRGRSECARSARRSGRGPTPIWPGSSRRSSR